MLTLPSRSPSRRSPLAAPLMVLLCVFVLTSTLAHFPLQPRSIPVDAPIQALPVTPAAPPLALPAELQGKPELVSQRTATSAAFDLGDGKFARLEELVPLHYQDADGLWQRINPAFAALPTGWQNNTNTLHTSLSPRTATARVGVPAVGIGWEPQTLQTTDAQGAAAVIATMLPVAEAQPGLRSRDGQTVRYHQSWSLDSLQDQWQSRPGASEYTLRLAELPALAAGAAPTSLDVRVLLHLQPGTTLQVDGKLATLPLETGGAVQFVGSDGATLELQAPTSYEQAARSTQVGATYRLAGTADATVIELLVRTPWAWLAAAERRFPVVIDPIFQMRSPTEARVAVYNSTGGFVQNQTRTPLELGRFGLSERRLMVRFALPTLPTGATISNAYFVAKPTSVTALNNVLATTWTGFRLTNSDWLGNAASAPQTEVAPVLPARQVAFSGGIITAYAGQVWDVTALANGWRTNAASNHGLLIRTAQLASLCNTVLQIGCGGYYFDSPSTWDNDELQATEDISTPTTPSVDSSFGSGLRLLVFYTGTLLTEGQSVTSAPPTGGEPYFHADHEFRLNPVPSRWQALVTRGRGTEFGPNPPTQVDDPYVRPNKGSVPLELRNGNDLILSDSPPQNLPGYILLNGRSASFPASSSYRLRVKPTVGDPQPVEYTTQLVGETANLTTPLNTSSTSTTVFSTSNALKLWNVVLPAGSNSRVDVEIFGDNTVSTGRNLYSYARGFDGRLFHQSVGSYTTDEATNTLNLTNNAASIGSLVYGSVRMTSGVFTPQAGNYGFVVGYNGPSLNLYTCVHFCGGEQPFFGIAEMAFDVRVRITSCDAASGSFPTAAGVCQLVRCPTNVFPPANYREAGNLGLWSSSGWTGQTTTPDVQIAPMIGGINEAAPRVVVVGGGITYSGATVTVSDGSSVMMVNCGSPTNAANPTPPPFPVYDGPMRRSTTEFFGTRQVLVPDTAVGKGISHVDPWRAADRLGGDLTNETLTLFTHDTTVLGTARLRRQTGTNLFFDTSWTLGIAGWPSLTSGLTKFGNETPPTIASLELSLGNSLSFDITPAGGKSGDRTFNAIRASNSTIRQPAALGGAGRGVQAVILSRGTSIPSDPPKPCTGSCIDLRGPTDTATSAIPDRTWRMPDLRTNTQANTVLFNRQGELLAWSIDHPNATQAIEKQFSFEAFEATVSVGMDKCTPEDTEKVLVIKGDTRIMLPNIGNGADPDAAISAGFKLCESSLRSVHLAFKSPLGIPLGNTGLFLTGLQGAVDIFPDYTTIKVGLDFQAAAGGDGGAFKVHGDVTIDTRGLFAFQGSAKILSKIDAEGKLWVAWNPLDIGFEISIKYKDWLKGFARAHLWKGQGWQNKYSWLPDNDETHIAAQIGATITIKKGAAFSWWFIDIPPVDIEFGIEIAFGQFCTNNACTTYEWGVKGALSILSYDIGLYYGFDHGFDFILGNDDHVLIDQYGGAQPSPIFRGVGDDAPVEVRAATPAVNSVSTEQFVVDGNAESLLFALGWQAGGPQLTLIAPNGVEITQANAVNNNAQWMNTGTSTLVGVKQPQVGVWEARIGNLSPMRTEHYKFVYFANNGRPGTPQNRGNFTAPAAVNESGNTSYTLRWAVPAGTSPQATISLRYHKVRTFFVGPDNIDPPADERGNLGQAIPIVQNLPFINGSYAWNTTNLASGQYRIDAVVDDGVNTLPVVADSDNTCAPADADGLPSSRAWNPNRFAGTSIFTATGTLNVTDAINPGVPTGLAVTGIDSAMLIAWTPSPERDVAAYLVRWGPVLPNNTGFTIANQQRVTAVEMPTLRLNGLTNNQTYGVDIKAIDASGNIGVGSTTRFGTPSASADPLPATPLQFALNLRTGTTASFSWAATPGAAGYRVVYTKLGDQPDVRTATTGATSIQLTGLETGATYEARVSARNTGGWYSASSNVLRFIATSGIDGNGDNLPDDWAQYYNLAPAIPADLDRDGLTNVQEYQGGTHPVLQDTDGDGWSDGEEQSQGTNPNQSLQYPAQFTQPRLSVDDDRLQFRVKKQAGQTTAEQSVGFSNTGGGTLPTLAATSTSPWITANLLSGDFANTMLITVNSATLAPGFHSGVVRLAPINANALLIGPPTCMRVNAWVSPADVDVPLERLYLPFVRK